MPERSVSGNIVDLHHRRIYPGTVAIERGRIAAIDEQPNSHFDSFILPGLIDAHVHVESSMMIPSEFARLAVRHGTVATVSDPHEIANVLGLDGVRLMIANGKKTPFKFHFGVPSCVPATAFETAGAHLGPRNVETLFRTDGLGYLSEMMNYPGVLHDEPEVCAKLAIARELRKPIDGHAPGLRGEAARKYVAAGITTDHECTTLDEALDKIDCGMKILIREGSAAKNFAALHPLLSSHPDSCMLCTDDSHPDALLAGHIDRLVGRAFAEGHDLFNVLRAACVNPVAHYSLPVGTLRVGDPADFIVVRDLKQFELVATYLDGEPVFADGQCRFQRADCPAINRFAAEPLAVDRFQIADRSGQIRVIQAHDGELITDEIHIEPRREHGQLVSDPERDLLKIAVVNRYAPAPPAIGFIRGFGLKRGAIAASVAHDSHNIVAVGAKDDALCAAVNAVIANRGGLAVVDSGAIETLTLEIAGLMSRDGDAVAHGYAVLDKAARELGSPLTAPFMTLSFMALLVIPSLKISDRGLFDGQKFEPTSLFVS
jgi:adenine deaminase